MGKSLKGKELGRGISQRKDGLYQARFTNRFGKRETIYAKTVTEITNKMREAQFKDEKQLNIVDKDVTLDEWFEIWISTYKKNCRSSSRVTYEYSYKRLREDLGWRRISTLNPLILQAAFNKLPSDESRKYCRILLVDMLGKALDADLVVKNVARQINVVIDNNIKEEKRILTEKEIELLLEESKESLLHDILVVALDTGMRVGEIVGLTWDSIDFKRSIISVTKTLYYLPSGGVWHHEFHPPKTQAGRRKIPMSLRVREVLEKQKEIRNKKNIKFGLPEEFNELVFTSNWNTPIITGNLNISIERLVNRINKKNSNTKLKCFTMHALRHTFASNCVAKGMRPKTLQKILGHSSLKMTMDLYCHVSDEDILEEMAAVTKMV